METELTNIALTCGYLLMWVATLAWYHSTVRKADGGTAVILFYILYAVCSIFSINDTLFSMTYQPLTLPPYLYLYGMTLLSFTPLFYHHNHNLAYSIAPVETKVLTLTALVIVGCTVLMIPSTLSNMSSGLVKLFLDADAGKDAYTEKALEASDTGSTIHNLTSIIFNALSDIAIFLCFYFMTMGRKKALLVFALFASVVMSLLTSVAEGARGNIVMGLCTIICCYFFFRPYLSQRINKVFQWAGAVCAVLIMLPVVAVTLSRFGDRKEAGVGSFITWYVGQGSLYFNNYALDAGGTRDGERTMNLFLRLVKDDVPANYVECRYKHPSLKINDHLFTTFVGDFVIDFGPLATVVIFIICALVALSQIRARDGTIKVHQLLLLYFTLCIHAQGGMCLFAFSFTGNLRIMAFGALYAYLRGHEYLLDKFPKQQTA